MLTAGTEASSVAPVCGTGPRRTGIYIGEFRMRVARRKAMTRISGNQRVRKRYDYFSV